MDGFVDVVVAAIVVIVVSAVFVVVVDFSLELCCVVGFVSHSLFGLLIFRLFGFVFAFALFLVLGLSPFML